MDFAVYDIKHPKGTSRERNLKQLFSQSLIYQFAFSLTMLFRLLFPGVVFHELSHYFACLLFGVKVYNVKLFGSEEAFVQHERPKALKSLGITLAPFILNNLLGAWLVVFGTDLAKALPLLSLLFYWLAVSLFFHSFPSTTDAMNSFNSTKAACLGNLHKGSLLRRLAWLFLTPIIFLPLLLLTGLLLLFDEFDLLKVFWVFVAIAIALFPTAAQGLIHNIFI